MNKKLEALSFDEILSDAILKVDEGRIFYIKELFIQYNKLLNYIENDELKYNRIIEDFYFLLSKEKMKAFQFLEYLFDSNFKIKVIINLFDVLLKNGKEQTFELLNSISNDTIINNMISEKIDTNQNITFLNILLIYNFERFLLLLNLIPNEECKQKVIVNNFKELYKNIGGLSFNYLDLVIENKDKNRAILLAFNRIFIDNKEKALKLLDNILMYNYDVDMGVKYIFAEILKEDKNRAFKLLEVISKKEKEKVISSYLRSILRKDKDKAWKLLNEITSTQFRDKAIITSFRMLFTQKPNKTLELLASISDEYLKNEAIETYFQQIFEYDIRMSINWLNSNTEIKLRNKIILNRLKKIQNSPAQYIQVINLLHKDNEIVQNINLSEYKNTYINTYINNFFLLEKKLKELNQKKAISKANRMFFLDKNDILNSNNIEFIFNFFLDVKTNSFQQLTKELKMELVKAEESNNYDNFIQYIISNSSKKFDKLSPKLFLKNKFSTFIDEQKLYIFIKKILYKIQNIDHRENQFLQLFLTQYPKNRLFQAIPIVAINDFNLAMLLLIKLKYLQHLVINDIFLRTYKKDLLKAIECYNLCDNFHTKVELSRKSIDHYIPKFKESFFAQTMSILDSQNIVNTHMDLATIAPSEVLIYYGEIEDDKESRVDEVIQKIKELKIKREEAKKLKNMELFKSIAVEAQKVKNEIGEDKKLFEAFLLKLNIDEFEFEDSSLWGLV